jgi:alanyl-tRNA synthetase
MKAKKKSSRSSDWLRRQFLKFFEEHGHTVVKSAPLVIKDDPTLLFNSAGMVQFKPYWTGIIPLPYKRACSVQKCFRLSDLERVGQTPFHDTFFEMLGNFSFGDYFKKEAIEWAWEFVHDVLNLPEDRLSVTVFKDDKEAHQIWRNHIGLPDEKIFRLSEKTNFWGPAGSTGACGPSSEIFFDLGEEFGEVEEGCTIENECDRFMEIWNIVFPQFDRQDNGSDKPLKNRGIDTGMGLERTLVACNDKKSIFDTDLFLPIIRAITKGKDHTAKKVIADHVRALTFTVTEGIIPSNEERGYVIRRLLRRAVVQGKKLGYDKPFLHPLVGIVVDLMSAAYPEIKEKGEHTSLVIKSEEERFFNTLESGMQILKEILDDLGKKRKREISGADAFRLYDTFGFPVELTEELAREEGISVDLKGYEKEMTKQRERAKQAAKFGDFQTFSDKVEKISVFVGNTTLYTKTRIIALNEINNKLAVLLEETPFYAEMGGQVGDTGTIKGGKMEIAVADTQPSPHGPVHIGIVVKGEPKVGMKVEAEVDRERRLDISRNHSATHLLQSALRNVLGKHVHQEGSMVSPDRLRFDFTHFAALGKDELDAVESQVNSMIFENHPVEAFEEEFEKAKKLGAIALFNEKYEESVRVLKIADVSMELCGGCHVTRTGEIGIFKITSEGSIASGVRRIEALTGGNALRYFKNLEDTERTISHILKVDAAKVTERLKSVLENEKILQRKVQHLENQINTYEMKTMKPEQLKDGTNVIIQKVSSRNPEMLRGLADEISKRQKTGCIGVFGTEFAGKAHIVAFVTKDLRKRINAVALIKEISPIIQGGGGGREEFATAGGKDPKKLDEALKVAKEYIVEKLTKK